ncbi:MAG: protein BatD, partial [Flavobacteriaceae bacterium]|nr:protein BatD [Flavobacteriaceae bacterium]
MKPRFYIFLFFAITIMSNLKAQDDSISFEAVLSKKSLGINENLRVDFKMNKDGDNFTPPSFKGFTVVGGPNQSVSNMWVNGKRTFSKSYSYFLT